ncbi:MAG: T9SS type A sorting domain-containing protein [Bacteroidota bacterium]
MKTRILFLLFLCFLLAPLSGFASGVENIHARVENEVLPLEFILQKQIQKRGQSSIELYTSSKDPKGMSALQIIVPIIRKMDQQIPLNIHYSAQPKSPAEEAENARQMAVRELHPEQFYDYLLLRSQSLQSGDWKVDAQSLGLDTKQIQSRADAIRQTHQYESKDADAFAGSSPALYVGGDQISMDSPYLFSTTTEECCSFDACISSCLSEKGVEFGSVELAAVILWASACLRKKPKDKTELATCILELIANEFDERSLQDLISFINCFTDCKTTPCLYNTDSYDCGEDKYCASYSKYLDLGQGSINPVGTRYTECVDCPNLSLTPTELNVTIGLRADNPLLFYDLSLALYTLQISREGADGSSNEYTQSLEESVTGSPSSFANFTLQYGDEICATLTGEAGMKNCPPYQECFEIECPNIIFQAVDGFLNIRIDHGPIASKVGYDVFDPNGDLLHSEITPFLTEPYRYSIPITATGEYRLTYNILQDVGIPEANCPPGQVGLKVTVCDLANATPKINKVDVFPESAPGNMDGRAVVTMDDTQGLSPFTFLWSNGRTTQDLESAAAGEYSLTVTDANGCSVSIGVEVPMDGVDCEEEGLRRRRTGCEAIGTNISVQNASYPDSQDGSINVEVSGNGPFYYYWADLPGVLNVSYRGNLAPGEYFLVVYDENFDPDCCYEEYRIVVEANCNIGLDLQVDYCPSGSLGTGLGSGGDGTPSIFAAVENGTAPFTFVWSNGANTQEISDLAIGNYRVTVTDADGCMAVASKKILSYTPLSASQQLVRHCDGLGDIRIFPANGGGSYEYEWSNGASTKDLVDVEAGVYDLTITDNYGCTLSRKINLTPTANSLLVELEVAAPCEGQNNGRINANVSGGQAPYSFQWSNGSNVQQLEQLSAGEYTLVVTDAAGCENRQVVQLEVASPPAYEISTDPDNGALSFRLLQALDYAPNIRWQGPGLPAEGSTDYQLSDLEAGIYCLEITDENGCLFRECVQLFEPIKTFVRMQYDCNGQTPAICVEIIGGSGNYEFEWLTHSNSSTCFENPLPGYDYCYLATDVESGDQVFDCVTYPQTENNPLTISHTISGIYCQPGHQTVACIQVEGGFPPYQYAWSQGGTQDCNVIEAGLANVVTVTDACGQSAVHVLPNSQPGGINVQSVKVNNIQSNCTEEMGSIIVNAVMTNPHNVGFSWEGPNGFRSSEQSLYNLTVPGSYTLYVRNRCNNQTIYQGTFLVNEINESEIAFEVVAVDIQSACSNIPSGLIDLEIEWDNPFNKQPLFYQWSNGATTQDISGLVPGEYQVTVSSGACTVIRAFVVGQQLEASFDITNSCGSGANGAFAITVTGDYNPPLSFAYDNLPTIGGFGNSAYSDLEAGTYNVTISDASGCEHRHAIEILEIPAPSISAEFTAACTNDGAVDLTIVPPPNGFVASVYWPAPYYQSSEDLSNARSGNATARIIYGPRGSTERCTMYYSVEVPSTIEVTAEIDRPCTRDGVGAIDLTVSGGTPPYTYNWSNGKTTQDISGLQVPRNISVTISDAEGCQARKRFFVEPQLTVDRNLKHTCINSNNGSAEVLVDGENPPFTYLWSNGQTSSKITGLPRGYYTVRVTDAIGCEYNTSFFIQEDDVPYTVDVIYPCDGNNGSIDLQLPSNNAPYIVRWSNGATSEDIQDLSPGNYTVTITNRNWCSTTETFELQAGGLDLYLEELSHNSSCRQKDQVIQNSDDGLITIGVISGIPPYTYIWSNGQNTQTISDLSPGLYTVTVIDSRGCSSSKSVNVKCCYEIVIEDGEGYTNTIDPMIVTAEVTPISSHGANDGRISLTITGGDSYGSIYWENEHGVYMGNTPTIDNLPYGVYSVKITDGCSVFEDSWPIRDCSNVEWIVNATVSKPCYSDFEQHSGGYIRLNVRNGYGLAEPLTYEWDNGETTEEIEFSQAGIYNVTITDKGGCTYSREFDVRNEYAAGANPYTCIIGEYCGETRIRTSATGDSEVVFVNEDPSMQPQANPCAAVMVCTIDGTIFTGDILDSYSIDQEVVGYEGDGVCVVKYLCELNIPTVGVQQKWTEPIFLANCCPSGQEVIEGEARYEECNSSSEGNECVFDLFCSGDLSSPITQEPVCLTNPIRVVEDDPEQECLAIILCGPGTGDELPGLPIRQEIIDVNYNDESCFAITLCQFDLPNGTQVFKWNNTHRRVDCCPSSNSLLVRESVAANCDPEDEDMECLLSYFCEDSFFEERELIFSECFDQGESPVACNNESCILEVSLEVDNFGQVTAEVSGTGNFSFLWTFMDVENGATLSTHTGVGSQIYPEDLNPDLPARFIVCVLVTDLDRAECFYASDCTITNLQEFTGDGNQFGTQRSSSKPGGQLSPSPLSPVQIAPNPFSDHLTVGYKSDKSGEIRIDLYNLVGVRVVSYTQAVDKGNNRFRLDLPTDLASGMYSLRIEEGGRPVHTENIVRIKP